MRSAFNTILLLLVFIQFTSCVKELIPENNGYKPSVVIWSILNADSNIIVVSSGNRGIDQTDVVNISSIDFFLFEDSVKVATLYSQSISSDQKLHVFNYRPKPNKKYTLRLFNQSFDISASIQMVSPLPKFDSIEVSKGESSYLRYTLTDQLGTDDAYQFDVNIYNIGDLIDTSNNTLIQSNFVFKKRFDKYDEPSLNYNFPILNPTQQEEFTFPVNDNLFDGKKKTFLFLLSNPVSKSINVPRALSGNAAISDQLNATKRYAVIRCRKISPEYYQFYTSESNNNSIFGTPYFNPTNVYSNIKGGLGLLASKVERVDTVWLIK